MPYFDTFLDAAGHWRWHLIAANGQKVATSGEWFYDHPSARRAAETVQRLAAIASVR